MDYNCPMIVDFHTHVFPPAIVEERSKYMDKDPLFAELYSDPRARLATVEDVLNGMDESGIERAVILNLGWQDLRLCMETNDYILEAQARYPDRLTGFAAVPLLAGDDALKELERCAGCGIKGVGELRPELWQPGFIERPEVRDLAGSLIADGLFLLIHASEPLGHLYPGKGCITPETIYSFIVKYPALKLICAHWGGGLPFYGLMPEVAKALENTYFDTAATPYLYKPQIFKQAAEVVGAEKILFGSDYPLLPPSRILEQLESTELNEADKEKIRGGNAAKLLGLNGRY